MDTTLIRGGLLPNPKDDRDLRVFDGRLGGGVYKTQPRIETLPTEFILSPVFQYTQGEDDCSANAAAGAKSIQDGRKLHAPSLFGFAKLLSGDMPDAWGMTHRDILKSVVKFGAIFEDEIPQDLALKDLAWWRDPLNWANRANELFRLAAKNRAASYMSVTGRYDAFDNIKTTIAMFAEQKRAVTFGLIWAFPSDNPLLDKVMTEGGFGHLVHIPGWTTYHGKEVLIVQNSWGDTAGDNGRFYVTRDEVDAMAETYGIYTFEDLPADVAKYYQENGAHIEDNWTIIQIKAFQRLAIDLLKKLVLLLQGQVSEKVAAPVPSKWLLPAIIWQESEGLDSAIGDNGNAFGCLQIWQTYMDDVFFGRKAIECIGNRELSIATFRGYMKRYATEKRLGRPVTDEAIARIHNGGPSGWKKPQTLMYWYQVRRKVQMLESGKVDAALLARITKGT